MAIERILVNPEQFAAIPLFAQLRPEELSHVAELKTIDSERHFA